MKLPTIEVIIVALFATIVLMFATRPIWFPIVQAQEAEEIQEILANGKVVEVTIEDKDIVYERVSSRFGDNFETKKYFIFVHDGREYFVESDNPAFFDRIMREGKIKVYFYEGKMLGESSDGTQSRLYHL